MTGPPSPTQQEGPSNSPPRLPNGYVAQWDGSSKKFYYVETATGVSSWTVPEKPSASVPVVGPTPQPIGGSMYGLPQSDEAKTADSEGGQYEGADRSLISDLATNALLGKHGKPQHSQGSSGLGGLASQLLSGGGNTNHGGGSHSNSSLGGIAGQLVGSLLDKPSKQSTPNATSQQGGPSSGSGGGLMGMASGFFGGQHASKPNYGYTSNGQTSSNAYTGVAPPTSYQPPGASNQSSTTQPQASQQNNPNNHTSSGASNSHPAFASQPSHNQSYTPQSGSESHNQHQQQQQQPPYPNYQQPQQSYPVYDQQSQSTPHPPPYAAYPPQYQNSYGQSSQPTYNPANNPGGYSGAGTGQGQYSPYGDRPNGPGGYSSASSNYPQQTSGGSGGFPGQGGHGSQNHNNHQGSQGGYNGGQQQGYGSGGPPPPPVPGWR